MVPFSQVFRRIESMKCHTINVTAATFSAMKVVIDHSRSEGAATKRGQAMIEFVVVAGILTLTVVVFGLYLYTFREQGTRVLDLIGADYP